MYKTFFKKSILLIIFFINLSTTHAATNYLQFPDLKLGDNSSYVQDVQKFLNSNGFIVNKTEGQAGSLNNEVTKFGGLTQKALMNFQSNYGLKPAKGYFGTKTKTKFDELQNKGNSTDLSSGTPIASSVYENKFGPSDCRVEGGNTVVRHWGFTWVVEGQRQCGQFVNGEWWVTGPTRLISSSVTQRPGIDNPINDGALDPKYSGTMKNPVPEQAQGFAFRVSFLDNTGKETLPKSSYDPNLNLRLKPADHPDRNLVPGDSIVSSKYGQGENLVTRHSTLTVVSTPPPEGSFRPPVYGNISRQVKFNKSQLNFGYFQNLDPVSNTPSQSEMELKTPPGTWLEWGSQFYANAVGPASEMVADGNGRAGDSIVPDSNYGADIAEKWGQTALWLNTRNPGGVAAKEQVAINMVQAGIDIAGYVEAGGGFPSNGGHKLGRKLPVLIAGVMLNDPKIKAIAANPKIFSEDRNVWYISEADYDIDFNPNNGPDTPRPIRVVYDNGSYSGERDDDGVLDPGKKIKYAHVKYTRAMHGIAEAGARHSDEPASDDADTQPKNYNSYRGIIGPYMSSSWLAAALMGIQEYWNHPAAFGYMERQKNIPGGGTRGRLGESMYKYYKSNTPKIEGSAGKFYTGDRITINITTTSPATIYYTTNGSTPTTSSTRYTGPFTIGQTATVKAIGVTATETSSVTSATYEIRPIAEKPLPKTGWTVRYVSSQQNTNGAAYPASNVLDGNDSTFWHSRYEPTYDPAPYTLDIDMKKSYDVSFFKYTPRQDSPNGRLQGYKFYMSQDGTNWGNPVVSGTFDRNDTQEQLVTLPSTAGGRYFRIVMDEGLNGNGTIGELNVAGVLSGTQPAIPVEDNATYIITTSVTGSGNITGLNTSYTNGSNASLTAVPTTGHRFVNWSGDCLGTQTTCSISMNSNKTIIANFEIISNVTINPPITNTVTGTLNWDKTNPVLYDNDDPQDVYTDEYLIALSSIGDINLKGFITTSSISPYNQYVSGALFEDMVTRRNQLIQYARESGLINLPTHERGIKGNLARPTSGVIDDTVSIGSPGSNLIVQQARLATALKPLVIIAGGNLDTIADAYLMDKTIADKVIVAWVGGRANDRDLGEYNGWASGWAGNIVAQKLRLVVFPGSLPQPQVPKARIQNDLPDSVFQDWMYIKHHPTNSLPDEKDYDGLPAIALMRSDYITSSYKASVDRLANYSEGGNSRSIPGFVQNNQGRMVIVTGVNQGVSTNEFWRAVGSALQNAKNRSATPGQVYLPKTGWTIRSVSSQENTSSFAASNILDGNNQTFWHSKFTPGFDPAPYTIDIDMKQNINVTTFGYTPRQNNPNGRLEGYQLFVSADAVNWGSAVAAGTFANNDSNQTVTLSTPKVGRYIRLVAAKGFGSGGTYSSIAEINVSGTVSDTPPVQNITRTLTTNTSGTGVGTITGNSNTYTTGSNAIITANAGLNSTFSSWSGDCIGNSNPCTISMNSDKSVIANFTLNNVIQPPVTSADSLISIDMSNRFTIGAIVPITLRYNSNSVEGLKDIVVELKQGDSVIYKQVRAQLQSGQNQSVVVNLEVPTDKNVSTNSELNVIAYIIPRNVPLNQINPWNSRTTFLGRSGLSAQVDSVALPETYTLSAAKTGNGFIVGISAASTVYNENQTVNLTAEPSPGSRFVNWTGGTCTGTSLTCNVTMNSNKSVTANFELIPVVITPPADNDQDGIVDSIDRCPNTPTSISRSIINSKGCIKPKADNFNIVKNLDNDDLASVSDFEIGKANIAKIKFKQSINLSKTSSAFDLDSVIVIDGRKVRVLSASAQGLNVPATITFYNVPTQPRKVQKDGTDVNIVGNYDAIAKTFSFDVTGFSEYELIFDTAPSTFTLTVLKSGTGTGVITGVTASTTILNSGATTTLIASANAGSEFKGWSGSCSGTTNCLITMSSDKSVTATFDIIPVSIPAPVTSSGGGSSGGGGGGGGGGGSSALGAYINPNNVGLGNLSNVNNPGGTSKYIFIKDLKVNARDAEVIELQKFLNARGYKIANTGAGSPGFETTYFGPSTQRALARFQKDNNISPAVGFFGRATKALINNLGTTNTVLTVTPATNNTGGTAKYIFIKDLKVNARDAEVIELQMFLNARGYKIANTGAGSPGFETTYFGPSTQRALARFQKDNNISPAVGFFGRATKALINSL